MTAFAWILGTEHPMRAFARSGVAEAVLWLGTNAPAERIRAAVQRLHVELNGSLPHAHR